MKREPGTDVSIQAVALNGANGTTKKSDPDAWNQSEHERFLEGLQLYQRDWKRIANHVGTKTVFQAHSYARQCVHALQSNHPHHSLLVSAGQLTADLHSGRYFTKVHTYGTGEFMPAPRPKRKTIMQMEQDVRAAEKAKKPQKTKHWYSMYQNLDLENGERNVASVRGGHCMETVREERCTATF